MTVENMFYQEPEEYNVSAYYWHWQSVLASFNQVVQEIKDKKLTKKISVVNLDDHPDISTLPNEDCIMLSGFSQACEGKFLACSFFIGVTTVNDANNHRLTKLISYISSRYLPMTSIKIIGDISTDIVGSLTFTDGTTVLPMSKSDLRSVQFIDITALSSISIEN